MIHVNGEQILPNRGQHFHKLSQKKQKKNIFTNLIAWHFIINTRNMKQELVEFWADPGKRMHPDLPGKCSHWWIRSWRVWHPGCPQFSHPWTSHWSAQTTRWWASSASRKTRYVRIDVHYVHTEIMTNTGHHPGTMIVLYSSIVSEAC